MKHGCIKETGTYEQLLQQNGEFAQFLREYLLGEASDEEDEELRGHCFDYSINLVVLSFAGQ